MLRKSGQNSVIMIIEKTLNALIPPFEDSERQKSKDMLFVAQEKAPIGISLIAASQHVLVVLMLVWHQLYQKN